MGVTDTTEVTMAPAVEEAFERFVTERRRDLERVLVARYGVEVGMDAAAEALAYAWREWDRVSTMDSPIGYLYRVGQSAARRLHRWRRTIALPIETHAPADATTRLQDALLRLNDDHRVAVVLVHSHGYSYEETAEMLGIKVSTLRNHLNRGLARLRSLLEETP